MPVRLYADLTTPSTSSTDVDVRHGDALGPAEGATRLSYCFKGKGHRDRALEFARRAESLTEMPASWTEGELTGAEVVARFAPLTLAMNAPCARGELYFVAEILKASR